MPNRPAWAETPPIARARSSCTSPRKPGEEDGPREVHLVMLDNGRSRIYADPQLRQTLYCIRCGTCRDVCRFSAVSVS